MTGNNKTQNLIMESALAVFNKYGFEEASVSEIVKRASVAQGTFYRYFRNKKECFNRLILKLAGVFIEEFNHTLQDNNRIPLIIGLKQAIDIIRENRELNRLLVIENRHMDQQFMEAIKNTRLLLINNSINQFIERGDSRRIASIKAQLINNIIDSVIINEILEDHGSSHIKISTGQLLESIIYDFKD